MNKHLKEFPVTIYGQVERYNDILSKARCRIFYKYENRNGTYISDEFAEKLLSTLPYVPVKGIYEDSDYTDHGMERTEGRIYGIVPVDHNLSWETHLDEDGVERTYACADVLIYTGLYKEATEIVGKAQSMELFEPSIKYHYEFIKGQRYVVFDEGSFLGLQVLGDEVEPCFEGASFFSLQESIETAIQKIKEYSKINEGESEMKELIYKLSDRQKECALWDLLNPECTEENNWKITYGIDEVYDSYALVHNYETGARERVYYTKDDETDSITIKEHVEVYVVDLTEAEKTTVETLRKLNGNTYELVSENLTNADQNAENCATLDTKIEELNGTIATLNTEVSETKEALEEASNNYKAAQETVEQLTNEVGELKEYKLSIETEQKKAVIEEYTAKLPEEVLTKYTEAIASYSVVDLDKELAYELKKSGSLFTSNTPAGFTFKDVEATEGIGEILARYKK